MNLKHYPILQQNHIDNLTRLADYLAALPDDYEHFSMIAYLMLGNRSLGGEVFAKINMDYAVSGDTEIIHGCGTVACAVGHGPAAGIRVPGRMIDGIYIKWDRYAWEMFTNGDSYLYEWLFGSAWTIIDNSPHGAAARIRYVLDGNPLDGDHNPDSNAWVGEFESCPEELTGLYVQYI